MNTIADFFKKNQHYFVVAVLLLTLFNNCQIRRIESTTKSFMTKKDFLIESNSASKNILRFDEDVDKKTKSIEDVMEEMDNDLKIKLNTNEPN